MNANDRIAWIDVARGLAILVVTLGHCLGAATNPLNKMILSFHMPLFFFLSGLLADKDKSTKLGGVKRSIYTLLIPQITLGVTDWLFSMAEYRLFHGATPQGLWHSVVRFWFLPVLLYARLLFIPVIKLSAYKRWWQQLALLAVLLLVVLASIEDSASVKSTSAIISQMLIAPMALLFYMVGYFCKNKVAQLVNYNTMWSGMTLLMVVTLLYFVAQLNAPVLMYKNFYGDLPVFFATTAMGIVATLVIARRMENSKFLSFCGKTSIAFFIWNFTVIRTLRHVLAILGLAPNVMSTCFLLFGLSVVAITLINVVTYKYIPIIYGKFPVKKLNNAK